MPSLGYSSVEIRVGFFVAFCLALFVALLMTYGKVTPVWRGRQEIKVAFSNVSLLRPDAPVRYNGVEVGRVKWMRMLHLDKTALSERFPGLVKRDLDDLPLREPLKRELRQTGDEDFEARCLRALADHTMIELCLEVLQEGDVKRYRLDDQIRIVSTIFGDAAVEIISGSGAVNTSGSMQLILGRSGDFFSNLAKSMGDVKEILSSVTEVVGTDERRSFESASARAGTISERIERMSTLAGKRSESTVARIDRLSEDADKSFSEAGDTLEKLKPQAEKTFENIKSSVAFAQDRLSEAEADASAAMKEVAADAEKLRVDIRFALDRSRPDFEQMTSNMRSVYDGMGGLSSTLEDMRGTAGRAVVQSEPDIARMLPALKSSLVNLKNASQAGNENKDLMIGNRDEGEYEYASALEIYRSMTRATRRIRETSADLNDAVILLSMQPVDAPESAAAGLRGQITPLRSKAHFIQEQLAALRKPLDGVRDSIETKMLPAFERKKSAWTQDGSPAN